METTIVAIATAPGRGGVGIIRISGKRAATIAENVIGFLPTPRHAHYTSFKDRQGTILDQGIALYFPGPNSFTGEDVLELQGHGGPVILDLLIKEIIHLGANLAKPGEFSERAYLNDKLDLTQAEAIADLIEASSEQAAKQALNSLQGAFSREIHSLVDKLIQLRIYVEAAIDFPEEEVDFLTDGKIAQDITDILTHLEQVFNTAKQGSLVREGMKVVIAGRPNAGKSSLLNALAGKDIAIVTNIAGTTRDVLREQIQIDGMPLHIIDTAGLRESPDEVEQIGIQRAWQQIHQADRILLILDATDSQQHFYKQHWPEFFKLPLREKLTLVFNKIDQSPAPINETDGLAVVPISAKTGQGVEQLRQHLKQVMSFTGTLEGGFSARRRHLHALEQAQHFIKIGQSQLQLHAAGELLAEDLRIAQDHLSEITGEFSPDDLLGKIFSSFCIGK